MSLFIGFLQSFNELLSAGIAITAFSLLLYALSFNLRDRVARTFALILVCVVIVFVGESFSSVARTPQWIEVWLKVQWIGIILLPPAYLQFSDALLSTTGRPSRGRRSFLIKIAYFISGVFTISLFLSWLVGPLVVDGKPAPHLQRTTVTWVFAAFYVVAMIWAWVNFRRAYRRTVTSTSRRRMGYLIVGALAPALGSYPYLLFGSGFATQYPIDFLADRGRQQYFGFDFLGSHGIWCCLFWGGLARPGCQTAAVQMDHARPCDSIYRACNQHLSTALG